MGFLHHWLRLEMQHYSTVYRTVAQDSREILYAIGFADKIVFGRTNYSGEISAYTTHRAFYNEQAGIVLAFYRVLPARKSAVGDG